MGRLAILPAFGLYSALAQTPAQLPDFYTSDHYDVDNSNRLIRDFSRTEPDEHGRFCQYNFLPAKIEKVFPGETEVVAIPLEGRWRCRRKLSKRNRSDGKQTYVDHCELECDGSSGYYKEHLLDPNNPGEYVDDWQIRAKRLVCKKGEWVPAKDGKEIPRCHNICGPLEIKDEITDKLVHLECMNLFSVGDEGKGCIPGKNCHTAATCYPVCKKGFKLDANLRESNEIVCKCDGNDCQWQKPKDLKNSGGCKFHMSSASKRIIGGYNAKNSTDSRSNLSCGVITEKCRKKRSPEESLIDHRRTKRQNSCRSWQHVCGGVLLTAKWAFTAAHCRTVGLRVVLGEIDFKDRTGDEIPCRVRLQIRHPGYDSQTWNDIMMLNMQCRRLTLDGEVIWPAKLPPPTAEVPIGAECVICGWGTMKWPEYAPATHLQCVDLPIMDDDVCNQSYNGAIHENIMCLGELGVGGQDSCQGDSGGGAYCNDICYGLVMGGLYCADATYPGVYTIVSHYVPWAVTVIRVYISNGGCKRGRCSGGNGRRQRRNAHTPPYIRDAVLAEHGDLRAEMMAQRKK